MKYPATDPPDSHSRKGHLLALALLAALVVTTSGCATSNIAPEYSLQGRSATGVAVVSLTQAGLPSRFNMFLELRGIGHDFDSSLAVADFFSSIDWRCPFFKVASESKPCGRLAVVELPAGEYEFYSWKGGAYDAVMGTSDTVRSAEEFSSRFMVAEGEAVYLGNVHFSVRGSTFRMSVIDRRERDLALLQKKNPSLARGKVRVELVKGPAEQGSDAAD